MAIKLIYRERAFGISRMELLHLGNRVLINLAAISSAFLPATSLPAATEGEGGLLP